MPIIDICNRNVITVEQDASVTEAAKLMRQHHVGDVVVVEKHKDKQIPIGIVTDRDVVVEVIAPEIAPNVITVGDIMVKTLAVIQEDAGMFDAIQLMTSKGVRRLPVVNKKNELVGIVTLDDLFVLVAKELGSFSRLLSREQKKEVSSRR
jgi:CBS domain-containing protein